jgi:hypothetical protein
MRAMTLILCTACALPGAAMAQDDASAYPAVTYPRLPAHGATVADFVPRGWRIEFQSKGDLDKDGRDDVVLVLRMDDPANIVDNEGLGASDFDTNPRLLAVLFAADVGYRLAVQDHALIPRPDNPVMADYLEGGDAVAVRRGAFAVRLHSWASAGSWSMGNTTFTFRHQDGCFRLIGYDTASVHRGSGETWESSLNFPAGKAVFKHGSIESDALETEARAIPRRAMPCLQDIGSGFEYDPGVESPFGG